MLCKNQKKFWSDIKKITSSRTIPVTDVDGYTNYLDIANSFASNYSEFLSSEKSSWLSLQEIEQLIKHDIISVCGAESTGNLQFGFI